MVSPGPFHERHHHNRMTSEDSMTAKLFSRRPALYLFAAGAAALVAKVGNAGFHEW
jgi:hypothetical protein